MGLGLSTYKNHVCRPNCAICSRPIYRAGHLKTKFERRSFKAVTCGRPCSKTYNRLPLSQRKILQSSPTLSFKYIKSKGLI